MINRINVRIALRVLATGLALVALAAGSAVAADREYREVSDRWNLQFGYTSNDTETNLFAGSVVGALINVEDVLDFDESDNSVSFSGFYRFRAKKKGKHSILFGVTDSQRESSGTVSGTVPILDRDFVGSFQSSYDTQTTQLAYRYSLIKTERAEAGISAGLTAIKYDLKLSGQIDTNGDGMSNGVANESADVLAPLPTFGFFLRYGFLPNLIFDISASSLDLEIGDIDGRVLNSRVRLAWYITKHFGIGLAAGTQDVNVTNTKEGDYFKVDYSRTTGTFFVTGVF